MLAGDIVDTAADADGLARSPLLVLDRVRAFLDEHGLGAGRCGHEGSVRAAAPTSRFCSSARSARSCSGARRARLYHRRPTTSCERRGCSSLCAKPASGGCRRSSQSARTRSLLGVPFYVMTYLDGLVPADDAPPGLDEPDRPAGARRRPRGRARRDPRGRRRGARPGRVRATGELQRAPGAAFRAALGDQQDA